jgi:cytochrome c nitrite reductase small subunit
MRRFFKLFILTQPKAIAVGLGFGLLFGLGAYTFVYAKGASYLTNDPRACANCHVMRDHFDAWSKSTHKAVATCNDCHTPPGLIGKYRTKASNGFWHSFAFTSGRFPDPLRIKPHNREIVELACRKCHAPITEAIDHAGGLACTQCHWQVGHPLR